MPWATVTLMNFDCGNSDQRRCEQVTSEDHRDYVGNVQSDRLMVGGIGSPFCPEAEAPRKEDAQYLSIPPTVCLDPQVCHPIS